MLCEHCNKREATIHYTEVINGVKKERHLCSECMQELDYGMEGEFPFSKLIRGILSSHLAANNPLHQIKCSKCQMTYNEFTKLGKFGCGECYGVFGPLIVDNIKKIQGSSTHTGKKYRNFRNEEQDLIKVSSISDESKKSAKENDESKISRLDAKLKDALRIEDYEEAARLRDEIKLLRERNGKND